MDDFLIYYKAHEGAFILAGIISIWFTVIGFFIATFITTNKNRWIAFGASLIISAILILLFTNSVQITTILFFILLLTSASLVIAFRKIAPFQDRIQVQNMEIEHLKAEIQTERNEKVTKINEYEKRLNSIIKPNSLFDRFENIFKKKEITYGFIHYRPFFWKEHINPKGIGYELLNEIFYHKIKLKEYDHGEGKDGSNWDDIFKDLANRKYDIIITPLFETRTRIYTYNVVYCSPLFYSNIGIYVRKKDYSGSKMQFSKAIEFLKQKMEKPSEWRPEILKGELSDSLVKKYLHFGSVENESAFAKTPATENDFIRVLRNVNSDYRNCGDFAFMEVFKANSILNSLKNNGENLDLINILEDNELLYPVSFVVRKEDTVLRNLINLRIIELRNIIEENKASRLENIIRRIAVSDAVQITDDEFNDIFIQKFDMNKIKDL